ncbi:alpha/beta hydrolase family protein [Arsukibacterium indicum]|uniref:S9 family peptidase n=1 Tax=Arsukibacterium indicum TaxID=2848612 RepID=A0ABS6MLB0_9GAMM|nr:S9 family peptidase [Arsukibacterium indicum]MBV2129590.1 S9 family peptidase [Arsukibacterium indicum]
MVKPLPQPLQQRKLSAASYVSTALLSAALFSPVLTAKPITLEQTVSVQSVTELAISADGQQTAFIRNRPRNPYQDDDGSSYRELFMVDKSGQETSFITGDVRVANLKFSPDNRTLYFTSKRGKDKFASLYKIAVNGGEATQVYSHGNAIASYDISQDGRKIAFIAKPAEPTSKEQLTKKGFKAEVYEEESELNQLWLADLNTPDISPKTITVEGNVLSADFAPDNKHILIRTAPTSLIDDNYMASRYQLINLAGDTVQQFVTAGKLDKAAFSPDGKKLAIIGSEDIHDPSAGRLLLADVATGKLSEILPDYMGHVQDIAWRSNTELDYLGHVGTEAEIGRLNIRNSKRNIIVKTGNGIATRLAYANQSEHARVLLNKAAHPNEVYALSKNGDLKRLTNSNPWLAEIDMPKQQTLRYQAADGLDLEGILVYPLNYQEGQQYPLVMVVHGGPEAHISNGWLDRYASPVKLMAAEGYVQFFPNYRGSTGRGVAFSKLGQNDYAGKEFDDLVDAKKHLVASGLVDTTKVGITGGSYGGYASAWAATKQTEHFAASVMFVGISNNLSKFGTTDIANEMHLVHARSYPWQKWQWYLERSPIFYAEQARTPILIMHGKEDTRVHPSQSMELYRYLKTHGNVPVRLVLYPGEGHGNQKAAAQLDYGLRLIRWMDHFLKQGNTALPDHQLPHADKIKAAKESEDKQVAQTNNTAA